MRTRFAFGSAALALLALSSCSSSANTTAPPTGVATATTSTQAANPTTTTTQPRVMSNDSAESSSWVSPQHGWVLEQNGSIDETTNGGATWAKRGKLTAIRSNTKIRFADSTKGFAFSLEPAGNTRLWSTDDGGVGWTRLDTPFSHIFDFAISRGIVYVVAMQTSDANFRIWSAPADQLHWTEDPLVVPVGAGPVPSIQLVLSGRSGWLVEVDRVVVAGARLANDHWTAWTPPCSDALGPARLAASSGQDVIATCDEHVWGGGPVGSAFYASHDGGTTFTRHIAPAFGSVASPESPIAVGLEDVTLQRTIDGGNTWKPVYVGQQATDAPADELGFTTSTQGFAITNDGLMLMTHDAGATWQKVTLP